MIPRRIEPKPQPIRSDPADNQRKRKFMKASVTKLAETPPAPVFPKTLHRLRPNSAEAAVNSKPKKRDNIFSKSRDTREDRGTREMKTKHNPQTLFQICALL
jgi:hypothetical protein